MSRPSDLPSLLQSWASGNFGAGANPWNGTPKRVQPGGTELTPNTKLPAQYLNYLQGLGFDLLQGLANFVGQIPAMNWSPLAVTSAQNIKRGVFNPKDQSWYGVGDGGNDFLQRSQNFGRTWATVTTPGSVIPLLDIAVDSNGNLVMFAAGTRTIYKGTYNSYGSITYAATVTAISANPSDGRIDFEATAGKFIAIYRFGAAGFKADWSTNGTAWTAGTLPAAWTGYTGTTQSPEITCIPGRAIAAWFDDTGGQLKLHAMRSTDGGATWTDVVVTPTLGGWGNTTICSKPAYNAIKNEWYISISKPSTRQTEIFRSTDSGATWATVYSTTTADWGAQDIQAMGELIVGINDDGRVFFSVDQCQHWAQVTINLITSAARPFLRVGGGGFMVWNSADKTTYASGRIGNAGVAAV